LPAWPPPAIPTALFFGRLERYKGLSTLLAAWSTLVDHAAGLPPFRLIIAGPGSLESPWSASLPPGVELRNRLIDDDEALALFRDCSLLVLPYQDATQSALIPAAYYFARPVIVTRVGALPEYVEEGRTGWVIPPEDPSQLAATLSAALSAPERLRQMGAAGRDWYDRERQQEWTTLWRLYQRLAQPSFVSLQPAVTIASGE
jgi:glycosyltransferase involved in cell wall biosynthesis